MKNLKKWFTLVELIVVITILAILGTIAFISLQGYSSDARNSKRTSDLNSLSSQVNIKATEGVGLISMVTTDALNRVAAASHGGAAATAGTNYEAGTVNFTTLGMKAAEFADPNGSAYRIGITTKKEGKFELAGKVEIGGGSFASDVLGNYVARTAANITPTAQSGLVLTVPSTAIGAVFYGDTIDMNGTATAPTATWVTVTAISGDGLSVTVSAGTFATAIALGATEDAGLIDGIATAGAVTDGDTTDLPY